MTSVMQQPLAYVHPDAKIADNVVIDPFSSIAGDVVIESGTWIGPHTTIMDGARIGKNCKIFPGASISAVPQDLKYSGEETKTVIEDNVTIREYATVNRGTNDQKKTIVGSNTLLMAYCHVAHDCKIGRHVILANAVNLAGHVNIDDYAVIGGMSAVHQFANIGCHAMVAGGFLVRKDVPPYVKAAREPLSYVGINSIGMRRRGFENKKINEIQDIYRYLFLKGYNISQALIVIEAELPPTEERDRIVSFIRKSGRGIIRAYKP